jgi:hypothetical protein
MKLPLLLAPLVFLAACNSTAPASTADSAKIISDSASTVKAIQSPYDIIYSSKFVMDDPKNAESLLGSRDSIIAAMQSVRNSFSAAVERVNAIMAVKSTDKNEHWALIWGMEKDTHKNGKVDSVYLQETWRFNQDGKADLLYQFSQAAAPMQKAAPMKK